MAKGVLFGQGGVGRGNLPLQEKDTIIPAIRRGLTDPRDRKPVYGVGKMPSDMTNQLADRAMQYPTAAPSATGPRATGVQPATAKVNAPTYPVVSEDPNASDQGPMRRGDYPTAEIAGPAAPARIFGKAGAPSTLPQGEYPVGMVSNKRNADGSMTPVRTIRNAPMTLGEAESKGLIARPEGLPPSADQVTKNRGVLKRLSQGWSNDSSMEMTSDAAAQMRGTFAANSQEQSSRNIGGRPTSGIAYEQARARWEQAKDDAYLAALPEKKRREVEAQRAATAMQRVKGTEGYQTKKLESDATVQAAEAGYMRDDERLDRSERIKILELEQRSRDSEANRASRAETARELARSKQVAELIKTADLSTPEGIKSFNDQRAALLAEDNRKPANPDAQPDMKRPVAAGMMRVKGPSGKVTDLPIGQAEAFLKLAGYSRIG